MPVSGSQSIFGFFGKISYVKPAQNYDFELVTTYENFGCCKPNLKYFEEICKKQDIKPEDSIMIGNDVDEDLCSAKLGFDTYLITDTIVNRDNKDYSDYKNGSFEEFYKDFLKGD